MATKQQGSTSATPTLGQTQAVSKRVFVHNSGAPPQPLYANAVEFSSMGVDVFMDVGIVSPEALQTAFQSKSAVRTVDFEVLYRFGMSLQTAIQLHQRLSQLIEGTKNQLESLSPQAEPPAGKVD